MTHDIGDTPIFLVGPMGAGKSTVGRQLARAMNREFIDSDRELERRTGVDIPYIFEIEGEAGFRAREHKVLDELTRHRGIVLATGGGAVLDPANREALSSRGYVIYLYATVAQQLERTRRSRNRPLLETEDREARLSALLTERDPLYREVAHHVLETDRRRVGSVVREILDELNLPQGD